MRLVITTTWNSFDHIELFLVHYRNLGFDRVVVMDFDSTDGTTEVLSSREWADFVVPAPFPGLAEMDSSNLLLDFVKATFPQDTLALFCDPDELLVTPTMDAVRDLVPVATAAGVVGLSIPRFNMTSLRSEAELHQDTMHALSALRFRAEGVARQNTVSLIEAEQLSPAWIFTKLPGKVLTRVAATTWVGMGDHVAKCDGAEISAAPEGVYLLHYPFRSWDAFARKVRMARICLDVNPDLPPGVGWQLRRWIRLADAGALKEEYLEQFPADSDLHRLVAEGRLTPDDSIIEAHAHWGCSWPRSGADGPEAAAASRATTLARTA